MQIRWISIQWILFAFKNVYLRGWTMNLNEEQVVHGSGTNSGGATGSNSSAIDCTIRDTRSHLTTKVYLIGSTWRLNIFHECQHYWNKKSFIGISVKRCSGNRIIPWSSLLRSLSAMDRDTLISFVWFNSTSMLIPVEIEDKAGNNWEESCDIMRKTVSKAQSEIGTSWGHTSALYNWIHNYSRQSKGGPCDRTQIQTRSIDKPLANSRQLVPFEQQSLDLFSLEDCIIVAPYCLIDQKR